MKLSKKLPLCSVALTALAVMLCCTILLVTTANNLIDSAVQSGVTELKMLDSAFDAEVEAAADAKLSEAAKRTLVLFVFRKYTDASVSGSHYILTDTEQTMFNDSPIDPRPLLPGLKKGSEQAKEQGALISDAASLWPNTIAELDGHQYLVAGYWNDSIGSKMTFEHEIFLVRDITHVYSGITAMAVRFAVIALVTVVLSALLMIVLVRRMLHPLDALRKNAAAIASGQYDSRIKVRGKDEIAELAESFNKMADAVASHIEALKDTAEQRMLLLGALTHELKTPMTAVIGYSEALMRVRLSKTQQEESVRYIHSECSRIERLAQKMMQLITLHGGQPADLWRQPVAKLYDAVEGTLVGVAKEEGIELTFSEEGEQVLVMDIDMMASVLINLFDNARKAGAKHISIAAADYNLCVSDDGVGIAPDVIKKITQPFYMGDKSYSRSEGGSGLGLALCELMVKAHGASMNIESELGKGTRVTIHF
jgi:two-component system phosphate regulon sensor histidine kinase PhoR